MRNQDVVRLPEAARAALPTLIGQGAAPARRLTQARILLKVNQGEAGPGWTDAVPATALAVQPTTVARSRRAYVTAGLDAALTPTAPDRMDRRTLDGAHEAQLVALACSTPPQGRTRWTRRLLAEHLVRREVVAAVSHETVRQTVKQTNASRS